ncbi:MBL fold metallo-hydrolase [Rhodococcus sp. D2-41]|uniref:MBL fold metallo-hydrolase n=1 Tax=Speluncibacter jeojiensis TaxID=2710754 RepID=UPI002410130E|nr:MBL fold metallo-hydrolase [Rhodococcus sp. D2-41]MDG3011337.1 MBL fold metallo-hydrolase [Rhodococcus sp. D2-41]
MLVTGFPAGMFQTNCYILALGEGEPGRRGECLVVDPGQDATGPLRELLDQMHLAPAAVLLTHGHLDHTWSVAPVCEEYGVPAYIHPEDRYMLTDPGRGIGPAMGSMIAGVEFREPETVIELAQGDELTLAGIDLVVDHTPGHTQGSVCLRTTAATADGPVPIALTGDTLFAGSIGRSDLPGGDHEQLLESIAERLLPLPDQTVVLPGHGGNSTIGRERVTNPFLAGLARKAQ